MSNKRFYEVGEEFFDEDLGFKVRCVEDKPKKWGCLSCVYFTNAKCGNFVCSNESRMDYKCKTPVGIYFQKVD